MIPVTYDIQEYTYPLYQYATQYQEIARDRPEKTRHVSTVRSFDELMEFAKYIAISDFCPKGYRSLPQVVKLSNIALTMDVGQRLGLDWAASLANILVIDGKPGIWGDSALALVKTASDFEYCRETFDEETWTAYCEIKRKNQEPIKHKFSKEDAITAGLWGVKDNWKKYPRRMTQVRPRSFSCRDAYPEKFRGLIFIEELLDIESSNGRTEKTFISVVDTIKDQWKQKKENMLPETHQNLMKAIAQYDVKQETIQKWLDRAQVNELSHLKEFQAQAVIEMLEKKEI